MPSHAEESIQAPTQNKAPIEALPGRPCAEAVASRASGTDPGSAMAAALQSGPPSVAPAIGGRPDQARDGRTMGPPAPRPGSAETAQHGNRPEAGQPAAGALDASALARDAADARMTLGAAGDIAVGSAGVPAGRSAHEIFAALDAGTAPGAPAWIHAGARQAEAGFQDPALGWVGVRADMAGAGIHAALVPGSADAAEALGGHLAGLNSYLAEQRMPVETLTLAAPEHHSAAEAMDRSGSQGMYQGAGQHEEQGASSDAQSGAHSSTPAIAAASPHVSGAVSAPETASTAAMPGGVHISVMA